MVFRSGSERPWWLRLDGNPPSFERRLRGRWPDWDDITENERRRRQLAWNVAERRDRLTRHPRRTVALLALYFLFAITQALLAVTNATSRPPLAISHALLAVVGFATSWWHLREFQAARRSLRSRP